MRQQNLRKVKWDRERNRAYVLRDGVRYWAPDGLAALSGDDVQVFNPDGRHVVVRWGGWTQWWKADTTSTGDGG